MDNEENAEDPEINSDGESSKKRRGFNCYDAIPDVLYAV
jgi:hypothetical protein